MTFVITVVSHQGLWQSSDHRLSQGGRAVSDASMKHVRLDAEDGKAIIAYAGLGAVNETAISEWVRKLLRGSRRPIERHLGVLKDASDRILAPICLNTKTFHTFSVAAFQDGLPVCYFITNRSRDDDGDFIDKDFIFIKFALEGERRYILNFEGTGALVLTDEDAMNGLITGTIRRRAKKVSLGEDVMALLARINKDVSQDKRSGDAVSPHCVVTFLERPDVNFRSKFFGWEPKSNHPIFQDLVSGLDVTAIVEVLAPRIFERLKNKLRGARTNSDFDIDADNEALRQHDFAPTDKL